MREMSKKNPYWLSMHRRQELKHFCLQYDEWKEHLNEINLYERASEVRVDRSIEDSTVDICFSRREEWLSKIAMIDGAAKRADPTLAFYIILAATRDLSYENLRLMHNIPCGRNEFYMVLRRFFYILDKVRK